MVELLDRHGLEARHASYDAVVAASDVPDRFCSSSAWILSAHEAFSPDAAVQALVTRSGWTPLALRAGRGLRWLGPLEASWGLACPFVGQDGAAVAAEAVDALVATRAAWDALLLPGLTPRSRLFDALIRGLRPHARLSLGSGCRRRVASLAGGADGFLARRSPKFRKALRQDERGAGARVVLRQERPVDPAAAREAFDRVLAVEARSWKGREGVGITDGPMRTFYAAMVPRLAAGGALRLTWAEVDGAVAGYVLGGVFGDTYRGLQFSYDASHAELGLGNLMQWSTVRALCADGVARYDLGTDMTYKARWAEDVVETVALVAR